MKRKKWETQSNIFMHSVLKDRQINNSCQTIPLPEIKTLPNSTSNKKTSEGFKQKITEKLIK